MTSRPPHRRISPRAKHRYRAIRGFFRKALGSSSQSKIGSSVAVNVTDLNNKIVGLEQQLNDVSKLCNRSFLESSFLFDSDPHHDQSCSRHAIKYTTPEQSQQSNTNNSTTRIIYDNSETVTKESAMSDYAKHCDYGKCYSSNTESHATFRMSPGPRTHATSVRKKQSRHNRHVDECDPSLQRYGRDFQNATQPRVSTHGTTEYGDSINGHNKRYVQCRPFIDTTALQERGNINKGRKSKRSSSHCIKYKGEIDTNDSDIKNNVQPLLDQNYLSDIVRRQYKPIKLYGRRNSAISQLSAPVCCDEDLGAIQEGLELRTHHPKRRRSKYVRDSDVSEMRSICDTRLYGSVRYERPRRRSRFTEAYNDSEFYDLIPVKEKSSPKSRRKFAEENSGYYREVPPSPRTLRPRLNLRTLRVVDTDDCTVDEKQPERKYIQSQPKKSQQYYTDDIESDITSCDTAVKHREDKQKTNSVKIQTNFEMHHDTNITNFKNTNLANVPTNIPENFSKTQDNELSDKTDKALYEMKQILQIFLRELKKDTSPQEASTSRQNFNGLVREKIIPNGGVLLKEQNCTNYVVEPQPLNTGFAQQFTSPCCCSMMTACPTQNLHRMHNCLLSEYRAPCTCHMGSKSNKGNEFSKTGRETDDSGHPTNTSCKMSSKHNETDELIKEIYKFVAKSPMTPRRPGDNGSCEPQSRAHEAKESILSSRAIGENITMTHIDAKVGTPTVKLMFSKSCEAIGSCSTSDTSHTNTTQPDTILEKLSLDSETQLESDLSFSFILEKEGKKSTLANRLSNFLFKKKKKDKMVKEVSVNSIEMEMKLKSARSRSPSPPCQQAPRLVVHYPKVCRSPQHESRSSCPHYPPPLCQTIHEHYPSGHQADTYTSPHYVPRSCCVSPQMPVCLKEIEVKSIGTQSERKMTFFKRILMGPRSKLLGYSEQPLMYSEISKLCPSFAQYTPSPPKKPGLISGWKKLHAKAEAQVRAFNGEPSRN